jgi:hypothetical protein
MNTATLVQATADIITVVSLKTGDVYKRLVENTYGEKYTVQIGVVRDVMHNGEDAVITALEFSQTYGTAEAKLQTFGTGTDLRLFTADPEEVRAHFADVLDKAQRAVRAAEEEVSKKRELLETIQRVTAEESARTLTAPQTHHAAVTQ